MTRQAGRAGQPIDLLPKEFTLLEVLMRNEGRVVMRTMLPERVWDFHFDPKTSVAETHISRLRAKIDKPFDAALLHTIRNAGLPSSSAFWPGSWRSCCLCARDAVCGGFAGLIALIALSRVHLLAHWPSDVLAGILFGGMLVFVVALALRACVVQVSRGIFAGPMAVVGLGIVVEASRRLTTTPRAAADGPVLVARQPGHILGGLVARFETFEMNGWT